MTETNLHIIQITSGRVLDAHDLLTMNGIDCTAFVEIKHKQVGEGKRGKRMAYAESSYSAYLFADLSDVERQMTLAYLAERKSYIQGAMGRDGSIYIIPDSALDGTRSIKHETGRRKGKRVHECYDRSEHSRFNLNRLKGQGELVPAFTEGDRVEFFQGGMQGLIYEVKDVEEDGMIHLEGEIAFFGGVNLVKVDNPYMLKKVA